MGEAKECIDEFHECFKFLTKKKKDPMKKFKAFMDSVLEEGALDTKTKELIALGIGISARCKYCISLHTKKALDAGATEDEITEVATVATLMGGGPALAYSTKLKEALEEFGSK